jgi:hypothetical protein
MANIVNDGFILFRDILEISLLRCWCDSGGIDDVPHDSKRDMRD